MVVHAKLGDPYLFGRQPALFCVARALAEQRFSALRVRRRIERAFSAGKGESPNLAGDTVQHLPHGRLCWAGEGKLGDC